MEDKYGNTLNVEEDQIVLYPQEGKPRKIGKLITVGEYRVYEKFENEQDTFRTLDAWSVNYHALCMASYIHFYTTLRSYWISNEDARRFGKFLKLRNSEEKIYIPKVYWKPYPPFEPTEDESTLVKSLGYSWHYHLKGLFQSTQMESTRKALGEEYGSAKIYPDRDRIFAAFRATPYDKVRVVILGQDPYADGQATGFAFETQGRMNPSLKKILEGMHDDLAIGEFLNYKNRLSHLSTQGVLLLNTSLTVRASQPMSHTHLWKHFTFELINLLNDHEPIVYLLWGKPAQSYMKYIDHKHVVLPAEHPSYAARQQRMWIHDKCFSKTREIIYKWYGEHIKW